MAFQTKGTARAKALRWSVCRAAKGLMQLESRGDEEVDRSRQRLGLFWGDGEATRGS